MFLWNEKVLENIVKVTRVLVVKFFKSFWLLDELTSYVEEKHSLRKKCVQQTVDFIVIIETAKTIASSTSHALYKELAINAILKANILFGDDSSDEIRVK